MNKLLGNDFTAKRCVYVSIVEGKPNSTGLIEQDFSDNGFHPFSN